MIKTVEISKKNGVSIGAHPSFNDPENFGRKRLNLPPKEITKLIINQINKFNFSGSNGIRNGKSRKKTQYESSG